MILFQDLPALGGYGVAAAMVFFVVFAVVAFIAFKLLKRTVKMAFRMAIVGVILMIAIAGSIALWALGTGTSERPKPARTR